MNLDEFKELGLEEEIARKAAEASKKELEGFIPKNRFEEVNTAKKQLEKDLKDRDGQLEELKKNVGDNEALQNQIKELKISNAIKMAVLDSAQDAELVASLIDQDKLILGDDGSVTGIDEQIKTLKESKGFLFKTEPTGGTEPPKGFKLGGDGQGNPGEPGQKSIRDAIAEHYKQG